MSVDQSEHSPLVSIIVRTKDRPKLLRNALKSVAAQTYRPIEVVLVNDGGCDLPTEELKDILDDVDLNYIRLEHNTGRAHAGNVGIENAQGEFIGFLDDDDELYPEHVGILADRMVIEGSRIVYSDAEIVHIEMTVGEKVTEKIKHVTYSCDFSPKILLIQNYIPFMCLLFHGEILKTERFDERFELFEDWKLLIKLSHKYWFDHVSGVTAKYNQWSNEAQINRQAQTEAFGSEAYLKVLGENMERITPDVLYAYCVFNATERNRLLNENATEKNKFLNEKQVLEDERDRIVHDLMTVQNYLAEVTNSLSWRLIERYRRLKDKVFPLGSRRRIFYETCLKSVKIFQREGIHGFTYRVKRKLRFHPGYSKLKSRLRRSEQAHVSFEPKISEIYCWTEKPVHIIMPVYNGYEYLRDCINSIFRNTDLAVHTLRIIDDKSTDHRVPGYLQKLRQEGDGKKIEVLSHSENMGFVKTINKGMRLSPEDVIILNSDTLVTKNWVSKLQRAAYSRPRVATATPLSNYVTLNGIPSPFHYNPIPCGMDVEGFSEFLEKISLRYYPEVPAGVGFCMYIKRDVLEQLDYFDEMRFEKGYAEETDFCMRALKKGFVHVFDDATYIYHFGGVSFESVKDPELLREKNMMIERNLKTLETLHPEYTRLVEKTLRENLRPLHEYIDLRIKLLEKNNEDTLCNRPKT